MKIIFLDIDGVLVNRASHRLPRTPSGRKDLSYTTAHPDCIAALNTIIEATGAKLVVSSVWRACGSTKMQKILDAWKVKGKER